MPDNPTNRDSPLRPLDRAVPAVEIEEQASPSISPNYQRVTRYTPPSIAEESVKDQQTVYEATKAADKGELRATFGDLLETAHDADDAFLLVSVDVNASRVEEDGFVAGYGEPQRIPDGQVEVTHRQAVFAPGVQFYVPTGDVALSDIHDALVHALRPQSSHHFAGP